MSFLEKLRKNPDYEQTLQKKYKPARILKKDLNLLVIADTHGDLARNQELQTKITNQEFDLCCVLGDIHYQDYKIILEQIPKEKIVGLLGNHDGFELLKEFGIRDIHGEMIDVKGIKIGGIHGTYRYKNENFPSFTQEESIQFLEDLGCCDVLLSHDKPFTYDHKDRVHDGLKGITKYLYENQVPINIHGHIHESFVTNLKNGTIEKSVYLCELVKIKNGTIE